MSPALDEPEIEVSPGARVGRAPATSHGELSHIALTLFLERGFDETTMDDIAAAAGIGRRTLFRYFSTKSELPWGDFDRLLMHFRQHLAEAPEDVPVTDALRESIVDFNTFPESERSFHRGRMWLLLNIPSLTAYSTLKYADWRQVVAEFVAQRRGEDAGDFGPQTVAWACLGMCIATYERWLSDENADLLELLGDAFDATQLVFAPSPQLAS